MVETQLSPTGKKFPAWAWILIVLVVLCLVCVVLLVVAFLLLAPVRGEVFSVISTQAPELAPSSPPNAASQPIVVEPLAMTVDYPNLFDLAPGWVGLTSPGEHEWQVNVSSGQQVMILGGWCAASQEVLEQNLQQITFVISIDDLEVPEGDFVWADAQSSSGYCHGYSGIVRSWPEGRHVIVQGMQFEAAINDGWSDYLPGLYTDRFVIAATP